MRQKSATADLAIAGIASRQHGVVTSQQMLRAGITANGIARRAKAGRLHRVHQGVYAVGHAALPREAKWMAAVLACNAALSHRSAAVLWGLLPARSGPVDVSVAGVGGRDRRNGIWVHRSRTLTPGNVTKRLGIPVTTPARTIADMRDASARHRKGTVSPQELRRATRQASVLGLKVDKPNESDRTRSELERLFLQLCRKHGLPMPEVNVRINSLLVDFLWRERRLIVETDGFRYHRGRAAFEDDRNRDLKLRALGYEVIRLSYRQIVEEPERIAGVLTQMLR